jgi:membrane protease YdiL (CAAX protease family)
MLSPLATRSDDDKHLPPGTVAFLVAALGITWVLQLPAVLARCGLIAGPAERFMLPVGLGGFGPLIAAVLVSRVYGGRAGVRALFRPLRIWRVSVWWYPVALGLFAAVYVAGMGVYALFAGKVAGPWLYPPENGQQIVALFLFPLVEEPGWRGFALPRLEQRYGALKASLLLGAVWASWHTMMFVLQGATPPLFVLMMVNIVAGSVVFSWLYNRTRGSLLLAVVLHAGAHLNNPFHALPTRVTPFVVYTVAICVVGAAVVLGDRTAWLRPSYAALE